MIEDTKIERCPPLQRLQDEHVSLREAMDRFYELTEDLEYESNPAAVGRLFAQLHAQVAAFAKRLAIHSYKEETALFPLMSRRLGPGDRTIETMEFEHGKAEQHLRDFMSQAAHARPALSEADARSIAVYAVQAHATLTQHFAKEEKMLFPLAERILLPDDKAALTRQLPADQRA